MTTNGSDGLVKAAPPKRKLSETVAERFIDYLCRQDLPEGSELLTEPAAMKRLAVSRGTFREAVRQLQWQGVVKVQRGVAGGLRTSVPHAFVPLFTLKHYFELAGVAPRATRRSFAKLRRAIDCDCNRGGNAVLDLFAEIVDGRIVATLTGKSLGPARLAERVAYRISLEIDEAGVQPGVNIGSEASLMKRLKVGRGVMREALRLMELNRVIELRRGVSGGVFVHRPSPEFAIYVCCVYLRLARVPIRAIVAAQLSICEALAADGCALGDRWQIERLAGEGARSAKAADLHPIEVFMSVFERFWRDFRPDVASLLSRQGSRADISDSEDIDAVLTALAPLENGFCNERG